MSNDLISVQISRLDKNLPLPNYQTSGSLAFDLYSRLDLQIKPQELIRIPSNLIIKVPQGYALQLIPRSSLFTKKQLIFPHSIGLIDSDFCGKDDEIQLQVLNLSNNLIQIKKGERLAQGLFVKTSQASFQEISQENLLSNSRGGFGSTGE